MLPTPNSKLSENQTLFFWCYRQRRNRKELEPDQIQKLQSIDFVFEIKKSEKDNNEQIRRTKSNRISTLS